MTNYTDLASMHSGTYTKLVVLRPDHHGIFGADANTDIGRKNILISDKLSDILYIRFCM